VTGPPDARDVVIELGEDHGEVPAAARRAGIGRRHRVPAWLRRWRFAGLALVLVLAYVPGGATVPSTGLLRLVTRLAIADGSSVMVDGDLLVVLGEGRAVTAYSARTGARVWRTSVSVPATASTMTASEGVVLVSRDENLPEYDNSVAVDEATGRVLWHSRSAVFLPLTGTGTVLMQPPSGAAVQLATLRTGQPRWGVPTAGCQFTLDQAQVPPEPHAFALLCPGGSMNLVRLPTGEVSAHRLPAGTDGRPSEALQLVTVGTVLVVVRSDGGTSAAVEAYRWRDGHRMWSRSGFDRRDTLYPCEQDICVNRDGLGVALDLETGADLPVPAGQAPTCCRPDPPRNPDGASTLLLVPAGRVAPAPRSATVVVPAQPPATGQYLQVYATQFRHAVLTDGMGPALVEVVDRDGRIRQLQLLPHVAAGACTAITTYLICPTAPGQVSVWRYPLS